MELPLGFAVLVLAWSALQSLALPGCAMTASVMAQRRVPSWGTVAMLAGAGVMLLVALPLAAGPLLTMELTPADYGQVHLVLTGIGTLAEVLFGAGLVKCVISLR